MATDIIIGQGKRTPFGDFGRSLKDIPMTALGVHAAKATLDANGLAADKVDHLVWGNVLPVDHDGYFASRKIALDVGMPVESAALNISRACGSGTQAIITAAEQIISGQSKIALAGGGENFSRGPYVMESARWGAKRGPQTMVDTLDWAYRDPFDKAIMGETAERLADDYQYTREAMDEWGLMSQQRAGAAIESGFLARQIAPIEVPERRSTRLMEQDEFPRPDITLDKLGTLRAVFRDGGRVTPGNSSGVTDGSGFVVVADRDAAEAAGIEPWLRLVDWTIVGVPPRIMGCGPVPAIQALWDKRGIGRDDIDYYEINEAFAVVNLHAESQLGIPRDRTNLYGGGISLGHPPGATGVRMTLVAMHHLAETGQRYACVSMCMGAGQGMAVLFENLKG